MGKVKKVILLSLLAALSIAVLIYLRLAFVYRTHFYQGTSINGLNVGGKSIDQAEQLLLAKSKDYTLDLQFRNDQKQTLDANALGYTYVSDGSVSKLMESQNPLLWPIGLFSNKKHEIRFNTKFDEAKLAKSLSSLSEMQDTHMQAPSDAFVEFQDNAFVIVPETEGSTLNKDVVEAAVKDAVSHSKATLDLNAVENAYVQPKVLSNDNTLQQEVQQMNSLVKASITYQLPNEELVLDGNTLKTWLVVDQDGHYTKDETTWNNHIKAFVSDLANKVNTVGKPRKFNATGLGEITVSRGKYGWRINQKKEIETLTRELNEGVVTKREPVWSSKELTTENNGFGNSYIEVDISRQHMWVYQNGTVTLESDIVTGRMTPDRYTPSGIYTLTYKEKDRDLKGTPDANGVPSYISHVNFWMPFNGGVGFHDASWRSNFGKNIYVNSGSHGCVNLPTSFAPKLYNVINKQMPIVVYYSNGCPLEK